MFLFLSCTRTHFFLTFSIGEKGTWEIVLHSNLRSLNIHKKDNSILIVSTCKEKSIRKKVKVVEWSCTVVPTKSDSDVIFCLQMLSKTLTCTLHLS